MQLAFYKYQGAGNDFVMIDNRTGHLSTLTTDQIAFLCNRNKGVGADGLILIEASEKADFKMVYYNADGRESSLCGNGGRCSVAFAANLEIIKTKTCFEAVDGLHHAEVLPDKLVRLQMASVLELKTHENALVLDTGSPHYVTLRDSVRNLNTTKEGAVIRYSPVFQSEGINVNFIARAETNTLEIRTYERGVENETLACGTGAVASALAADYWNLLGGANPIKLHALGGTLQVAFEKTSKGYENITLLGPAEFIFSGTIDI